MLKMIPKGAAEAASGQEAKMDRQANDRISPQKPLLPALAILLMAASATAQVPVDEYGNPIVPLDEFATGVEQDDALHYADESGSVLSPLAPAELEELVGPIALYPDDLLAIVLPASTYPLQIVQAARFLDAYANDSTLKPDEEWDESITALLNYPDVLRMLDDDIDWTWKLGEAVISQQADIINAVESFRDRAYVAGNLKSDERQTVTEEGGVIEITPVDEEIIYVPYYEPEHVVVYQPEPVYHYYARPYPVYYYPYPAGYAFSSGYFWGVTSAFRVGWATNRLRVRHYSYWGHPYYGRNYYGHYYRRPSINVHYSYYNDGVRYSPNRYRDGDYWRPRSYGGPRPGYHGSVTQTTRSVTGSVSDNRNPTTVTTRDTARPVRVREDVVVRDERTRSRRSEAARDESNEFRFRSRDERDTVRNSVAREPSAPSVRRDDRIAPVRATSRSTERAIPERRSPVRIGDDASRTRIARTERTIRTTPPLRASRPESESRNPVDARDERVSVRRGNNERRRQRH